jgi:urocanate hydratase
LEPDFIASTAFAFALQVERFYAGLISGAVTRAPQAPVLRPGISDAGSEASAEPGLGGKLLYAGELNPQARALMVAASIVGAASLAAAADPAARKQAMRDGVVDFLVTSLDEALRILKNEIRKRQTVAVCVALEAPEADFACEMQERGIQPDLVWPDVGGLVHRALFVGPRTREVTPAGLQEGQALLVWRVASSPATWLPKLDAIALDCLSANSSPADSVGAPGLDSETGNSARRWLRLAPRYLGRMAQGVRLLRCNQSAAARFQERVRESVECGEIAVAVEIKLSDRSHWDEHRFSPSTR